MKKRLVVGLTGSFGSGKTTASRMFARRGAYLINADDVAHEALRSNHPVYRKIKSLFGVRGKLSRAEIAREIFRNPSKRKKLEALIHPYVKRRIKQDLKKIKRGVVIVEVPLLFESRFDRLCDVTVSVLAGQSAIIRRLRGRGFSKREVTARLRAQMSQVEKRKKSDYVIMNSNNKNKLNEQVGKIWNILNRTLKGE